LCVGILAQAGTAAAHALPGPAGGKHLIGKYR
jgi:hypothetical protein